MNSYEDGSSASASASASGGELRSGPARWPDECPYAGFQDTTTTSAWEETAQRMRERILSVYRRLDHERSLAPTTGINVLFEELVGLALPYQPAEVVWRLFRDPMIAEIHQNLLTICAVGEYELERHWAEIVITAARPTATLRRFPYYQNYQKHTDLEGWLLRNLSRRQIKRALFVGAGPLPLTSVLLTGKLRIRIDSLDVSHEACQLARSVIRRLAVTDKVRIQHADVRDLANLVDYDAVVVAALAGLSALDKAQLIEHIRKSVRPGCLILLRSAENLRRLLYPRVQAHDLVGLDSRFAVHPRNEVINSILAVEKPLVHRNGSERASFRSITESKSVSVTPPRALPSELWLPAQTADGLRTAPYTLVSAEGAE